MISVNAFLRRALCLYLKYESLVVITFLKFSFVNRPSSPAVSLKNLSALSTIDKVDFAILPCFDYEPFSQIEFVTTWWLSAKFLKQNYQKVEMSPFCAYYIKSTKGRNIIINFHVITISFTITQLIQYLMMYIQFQ